MTSGHQPLPKTWLAGVVFCAVMITVVLAVHHGNLMAGQGLLRDNVPIVGNNDGYFYLDRATSIAAEGRGVAGIFTDKRQSMLLPYLLAAVAGTDRSTLHLMAAYIGPVLSLSMLLAVLPWAMEFRSRFVMAAAPILALLAPYWIARTHVGFLDTDSLVPGLCSLSMYCLFRFASGTRRRTVWALLYVVLLAILWFWWRPGAFLVGGFLFCYLIYPSWARTDVLLKGVLVGAFVCAVGLAVAGIRPFSEYGAYVSAHLGLVFGGTEQDLLGTAIRELGGVSPGILGQKTLGSPWLLLPVVLGAAGYCFRYRWKALFLMSMGCFGAASMISQRFIPLFVPVAALLAAYGVALCVTWVIGFFARFPGGESMARPVMTVAGMAFLLTCAARNAVHYEPESYFSKSDFVLADTVRRTLPPETVLWSWWDYGYFLQYLTGMKTFFDGGSQTEATCFVAAYPLMQEDLARASAWIRHYAFAWPRLDTGMRGAGWDEYVTSLTEGLGEDDGEASVALVLPARVNTTVGYLYSFAHVFDTTVPPVANHLDIFPKTGFAYDADAQTVVVPEAMVVKGYDSVGSVLDATGKEPGQLDFTALPDPYLVFSRTTDFLAVTDRAVIGSVLFRLLGLFEYDRHSFEPLYFDSRSGGVWLVR
ncbi:MULTISPECIES: hypothetical protein [unclassified Pseudodesulfovibrio]|uniref:hypothetical protein n=1 Tax=unclassified Pseudodesulfovibrio TaxID=2661612 RepID=UPI000FEBBA48|nr:MULTISPECIES: hypothetical protein [unclassified Pseudodesulfovibrio]MCJ2164993.1 hypothetical protein [Pseudodesulfovibrio sp. S3-i]RWU03566.1 hypothetical protein DWB63_10790 [Pseudodesulfovibrio sp. S3]